MGGAISPNASTTLTLSGTLNGSGGLTMNGAGTLVLSVGSGGNTFTNGVTVTTGTLQVSADNQLGNAANNVTLNAGTLSTLGNLTTARAISISGGGTIASSNNLFTVSGVISGSGGLTTSGGGIVTLSGTNTYTGGTTVAANTNWSADANFGNAAGAVTLANDNAYLNSTATFISARAVTLAAVSNPQYGGYFSESGGTTLTLTGVLSGIGNLIENGAGTLVVSGTNTYQGGTIVQAGTLSVGADANLGQASGGLTLHGGSLVTTATFSSARAVTLTGGAFSPNAATTLTLSGVLSGAGGLTLNGAGTVVLSGTNTYTGGTTVTDIGTLDVSSAANLGGVGNPITLGGAAGTGILVMTTGFNWSGTLTTAGANGAFVRVATGQSGTFSGAITNNGLGLTAGNTGVDTGTVTLSGPISGTGSVSFDGNAVLSGTNSYTGATFINRGTVQVSADANLGNASGGLTLSSNGAPGALETTATFTSARAVTLSGGAFSPNAATTLTLSGVLSGSGGLTLNGAGTLLLSGTNTYTGGNTITAGTLDVSADNNLGNAANAVTLNGGTLESSGTFSSARAVTLGGGVVQPGQRDGADAVGGAEQ